jgi:putative ABC transport system permease protein
VSAPFQQSIDPVYTGGHGVPLLPGKRPQILTFNPSSAKDPPMNELFGIQMTTLTTALVVLLSVCLLSVAWIGLRRPVILKMGIRNLPRRKAQTVLIVVGLMLSTLIITSALGVGDTVDHSVTSEVYDQIGHVDELVVEEDDVDATSTSLDGSIPVSTLDLADQQLAGNPNVDGVMPVLAENLSAQNEAAGLGEPDILAIGLDPERVGQFGDIEAADGGEIDLASMPAESIALNKTAADLLGADTGDTIQLFVNNRPVEVTVAGVAKDTLLSGVNSGNDDTGDELGGLVMPLAALQQLTGNTESYSAIAISNTGSVRDTIELTDDVTAALAPALEGTGAGVNPLKETLIDDAVMIGQLFTGLFLVVGLFSIAAGILLILLIFTMLAAERRPEMGMARAVGAQRGQLVQQFISEGAVYSLLAGMVGAALGVVAAIGIGYGLSAVFGDFVTIDPYISIRSVVAAYCLGVVITFIAVAGSSWKISRLNVVAAIRDLPDVSRQRASWRTLLWPVLMVAGGVLMTLSGISSGSALPFMGGVSLLILGVALIARLVGVPSRLALTAAGLLTLVFWLLPQKQFEQLFGEYDGDFEMFFLSGLFLVISATLVIMQNDRVILSAISRLGGIFRSRLSSIRLGIAYPGAARGRTGMTVAMFSLIVFSLVTIATINLNFSNAFLSDASTAGWDVRGSTVNAAQFEDFETTLQQRGVDTSDYEAVGVLTAPSTTEVHARVPGEDVNEQENEGWKKARVLGMDAGYITATNWDFGNRAEGYESDQAILDALMNDANVAIVDSFTVSGGDDMDSGDDSLAIPNIDLDEETFAPVTIELEDADGEVDEVTIIGVLDPSLSSFEGIYTNQATTDAIYGRPELTSYQVQLASDDRSEEVAREIEAALLPYGVQGTSIQAILEEDQQENNGFFLILQAFMGLGMLVGVAAIGVIAFRNVVDRRQQIGVLRALGFQQNQVSLSFLIESAFIVGLGVVSGTALGLTLARNLMTSGEIAEAGNIDFVVPWDTVSIVLALAVGAALLMTWLPARQASRIAPAEALRYE